MANTITALTDAFFAALYNVGRKRTGLLASAFINTSDSERVAKGQTIKYPVVPAFGTPGDWTPSTIITDPSDRTITTDEMSINNVKSLTFKWNGDEQFIMNNNGTMGSVAQQTMEQIMENLAQAIETYAFGVAYKGACRAVGTAATTPFASNFDVLADALQILIDNGTGTDNLKCVIDTTASTKLRKLATLLKVNESGTDNMVRRAIIDDLYGFQIRESNCVPLHTAGTGSTSYAVNLLAGYAAGSTTIALDGGSGTILAGDVFTNSQSGRDANKYIVKTALSGGSLVLNNPGIRAAWVDNDTTAVGAAYRANLAFKQNAIHILTRLPKMPVGGDSASMVQTASDPSSGLSFMLAEYKGHGQNMYEVSIAYDAKVVKSDDVVVVMG